MAIWFGWPLICLAGPDQNQDYMAVIVGECFMVGGFFLARLRCSSPVLPYWTGLSIVGSAWRTGVVQLSMLIACPIVLIAQGIAILIALVSFAFGKTWAERSFMRTCHILSRGKFDLQKAVALLTAKAPST
jgi:hypothetical protein